MNSDALTYLLEIAETGSFNKAAQNLFISQPAIRSTISKLENDIGAPLLNRTKYGCTLTPLGEKVVSEAPIVLNYFQSWKDFAATITREISEIVICATKPFCSTILSPLSIQLQSNNPHLKFIIKSSSYANSIAMLRKAQCQVAIIHADLTNESTLKSQLHLSNDYVVDKIMDDTFLALINKNSSLYTKIHLLSTDLMNHTYCNVSQLEMLTTHSLLRTGYSPNQSLFFDSHHSVFQAINQNEQYYSLLSSILSKTKDYKTYQNVSFKQIIDLKYTSAFYLIYSKSNESYWSKTVYKFIKNYCLEMSKDT